VTRTLDKRRGVRKPGAGRGLKAALGSLLTDLKQVIELSRAHAASAVNVALVARNWRLGRRILDDILAHERAGYGEEIVATLSRLLTAEYGKGFSRDALFRMVQCAQAFPDERIVATLSRQLGWSHFVTLVALEPPLKRDFYAEVCRIDRWSVRTLRSKSIMLELGTDFTFVARQKRMTIDGEDYYLDLLFYHRRLRRLVAIELKLGRFRAADKGQMELYLRWLDKHGRFPGEESPIGLILCADKSEEHVALLRLEESGIRVAQYVTELPPREVLERKLHDAIRAARSRLVPSSG
jgi:hypothetical protein